MEDTEIRESKFCLMDLEKDVESIYDYWGHRKPMRLRIYSEEGAGPCRYCFYYRFEKDELYHKGCNYKPKYLNVASEDDLRKKIHEVLVERRKNFRDLACRDINSIFNYDSKYNPKKSRSISRNVVRSTIEKYQESIDIKNKEWDLYVKASKALERLGI